MQKIFTLTCFFLFFSLTRSNAQVVTGPDGAIFNWRVVKDGLSDPWEITYGPDGHLWITESKGYTVSRIEPATGAKTILLDLNPEKNFPRYDMIPDEDDGGKRWPQGGLMGLALHPQLLTGKPYVYLAYVYEFTGAAAPGDGCLVNGGGCFYKTRVVRYNYNFSAQALQNPVIICDTIPGSSDHNSGRMTIAPLGGIDYLFYTVGDMGAGQYENGARANNAQATNIYEGKVLRFNLETDGDPGAYDQWIPNNNPFNTALQNAVWTYGHRNAQGITYAEIAGTGRIYSDEHGPFSDDEVNIIERQKNYGHPLVIGLNDGNYNGLAAGTTPDTNLPGEWQTTLPTITDENANVNSIGLANYGAPLKSLYPSSKSFLEPILNAVRTGNNNDTLTNALSWQSEAPSSIEVYSSLSIPGWSNSLLMTTLKGGKMIRLKLNSTGDAVTGDTINYFKAGNRYRDIAISPDGTRIYLAVDSSGVTSGPTSTNPQVSTNRGTILEFTYVSGGILALRNRDASRQTLNDNIITLFPNPASDRINVSMKSSSSRKRVRYLITGINGTIILENSVTKNNFDINISSLAKGVYILEMYNDIGVRLGQRKIIKQ